MYKYVINIIMYVHSLLKNKMTQSGYFSEKINPLFEVILTQEWIFNYLH